MGDEYVNVLGALLSPGQPLQQGKDQEAGPGGGGASNQSGLPQGATEQAARGAF